jgi:uncharacterized membrane protein YdjX (TVP38/TMEM64 family)
LALLLASDILLPIPSSLASTAAGIFAGFVGGTLASWVGMTVSCVIGYRLAQLGRPLVRGLVGGRELDRLEMMNRRFGMWAVVLICRSVPVLGEASVLFAGMNNMPFGQFLSLVALANLAISIVYAAVGAFSATVNSFLFAFGGSIVVLGLLTLVVQLRTRERPRFARVPRKYPVTYTCYNEGGGVVAQDRTEILDITPSGALLLTEVDMADGSRLDLELQLGADPLSLQGRVVYTQQLVDGSFRVGITFESLPAQVQDRLRQTFSQLDSAGELGSSRDSVSDRSGGRSR